MNIVPLITISTLAGNDAGDVFTAYRNVTLLPLQSLRLLPSLPPPTFMRDPTVDTITASPQSTKSVV